MRTSASTRGAWVKLKKHAGLGTQMACQEKNGFRAAKWKARVDTKERHGRDRIFSVGAMRCDGGDRVHAKERAGKARRSCLSNIRQSIIGMLDPRFR